MSTEERDLATFLSELQDRLEKTRQLEAGLAEQRTALEARESRLSEEWAKREAARFKELDARFQAAMAVFDAQARAAIEAISESAAKQKAAEHAQVKAAKAKREMSERFEATVNPKAHTKPGPRIEEDARVRLRGIREPARVRRSLGNGRWEVEAGNLKLHVSEDEMEEVLPPSTPTSAMPKNVSFQSAGPAWDVSYREINIIGQHAEEAAEAVDKFLDNAAMASVDRVRIVHGHGMGVLKRTVHDLLSSSPHVARFYPAAPAEGGSGATVAELK